jgi:hypothetical protein
MVLPVRRLAKNGFEAWAEVIAHDYEGLVAKEEASLYEARADAAVVEGEAEGLDRRGGAGSGGSALAREPSPMLWRRRLI